MMIIIKISADKHTMVYNFTVTGCIIILIPGSTRYSMSQDWLYSHEYTCTTGTEVGKKYNEECHYQE